VEAMRAEIRSQLDRLNVIQKTADERRRERRKARRNLTTLVAAGLASWVGTLLFVPPVESLTNVFMLGYGVAIYRQVRKGPLMKSFMRPTVQVLVLLAAVTVGTVLQEFVSPGRLPAATVTTPSGSVTGFLVAQTDTQTTVGLPDCRIEALPSTAITSVIARPRSRRYGKTIGTLLLDQINGTRGTPPKGHPGKCGG
jgi:hypothetical protein